MDPKLTWLGRQGRVLVASFAPEPTAALALALSSMSSSKRTSTITEFVELLVPTASTSSLRSLRTAYTAEKGRRRSAGVAAEKVDEAGARALAQRALGLTMQWGVASGPSRPRKLRAPAWPSAFGHAGQITGNVRRARRSMVAPPSILPCYAGWGREDLSDEQPAATPRHPQVPRWAATGLQKRIEPDVRRMRVPWRPPART